MSSFISLAVLIYVSRGQLQQLQATGCIQDTPTNQNAQCAIDYSAVTGVLGQETPICDPSNTDPFPYGICTVTCVYSDICSSVSAYVTGLSGVTCVDDQSIGKVCKGTVTTPTTSAPNTDTTAGTDTTASNIDTTITCPPPNGRSCSIDSDCDALLGCMDELARNTFSTSGERAVCLDGECTVTCITTLSDVCAMALSQINAVSLEADQIADLTCVDRPSEDPVCMVPEPQTTGTQTTGTTETETTLDISCVEVTECANINALYTGYIIDTLNEAWACVDNICTITCNDEGSCATAASLISAQLVCDGSVSPPVCVEASNTETSTTLDTSVSCDDDICGAERLECNEEGIPGWCSVEADLSAKVCILNHGFKKAYIYGDFRHAFRSVVTSNGELCDNGEIFVTGYACALMGSPSYIFDTAPSADTCPTGIDTACVNANQANFAASIEVSVAMFCECDDVDDLQTLSNNVEAALITAKVNFVDEVNQRSMGEDAVCETGFGFIVADTFTITVYDGNGDEYAVHIDITGGAVQGYFYMASVVAVVILAFL